MPLSYLLAFRSAVWYLRVVRGLCGDALTKLHSTFLDDEEAFGYSVFFKPARDFVTRMGSYVPDVDLYSCSIVDAKRFLREAVFLELDRQWKRYSGARTCHKIHPT